MTLGWSDGDTFMLVNRCLVASTKESNLIDLKIMRKDRLPEKRRKLAQVKVPEVMLNLIDTAVSNGIAADYVLFDS